MAQGCGRGGQRLSGGYAGTYAGRQLCNAVGDESGTICRNFDRKYVWRYFVG